jgi:hypothetical protein
VRRFLLIFAISLIASVGANAQIHPATSALASASPSLAPPLPSGNGDGTITSTIFEGPTRFEAGIEYAWTHAEAAPNLNYNLNGFVGSLSWFFVRDLGVEGQLLGGWGGGNTEQTAALDTRVDRPHPFASSNSLRWPDSIGVGSGRRH